MSFDPTNPKNAESPALFPAENRRNMLRLQTLFNADHQFNDPPATNDGWHKIVHWIQQGSNPIDPLNPTADAPSNAGGPPISWEQPDTYNVDRVWLRQNNGGNVTGIDGFNEIRVNNFMVPIVETALVTPPDNTYGDIYYTTDAIGQVGRGTYWKSGGNCYSVSLIIQSRKSGGIGPGACAFGGDPFIPQPYITVNSAGGVTFAASFRIIYRYI